MRRFTLFALVALVLATAPVRADFTGWHYDWTVSPTTVSSASGDSFQLLAVSGTSTQLSDSVLVMGILAPSENPQSPIEPTPYQLTLVLTDLASNASGTTTFNGTLSGSYANLSNSFTGPTTKQLVIGSNTYTISLGSYFAPFPLLVGYFPGILPATISASPEPQTVPEPATLALAGCALPGLALAMWRRRT